MLFRSEFAGALKAKYVSLSRRLYAHKERQGKKLAAILDHMAAQADMTPSASMSVLATADSSDWGSQGLGANKYAEASLAWERDLLLRAGFAAEIRQESANYRVDAYGFGYTWCTMRSQPTPPTGNSTPSSASQRRRSGSAQLRTPGRTRASITRSSPTGWLAGTVGNSRF